MYLSDFNEITQKIVKTEILKRCNINIFLKNKFFVQLLY